MKKKEEFSKNEVIWIYTEAQYKKLQHAPFNREYGYRTDLAKSMKKSGWLGMIIIIKTAAITGKLESFIIDGQNRAATAIQLGIPFRAEVIHREFLTLEEIIEFVATLNTTQMPWSPEVFVKAWTYLGRDAYKVLTAIKSTCDFTITTVAAMLYGFRSRSIVANHIRQGTFTVNLIKETEYTIKLSQKLLKYGKLTSRMAIALHYVCSLPIFNEAKFIAAYKLHYKEIKDNNIDDFSDIFTSWVK